MKRFHKYLLAMLLPLTVLMVRPLTPAAVLLFGQEVRLSTEPVDPRDLFRGDYVTLRFSIEQFDERLLSDEDYLRLAALSGRLTRAENTFGAPPVYVYATLEPGEGGIWSPVRMSLSPPGAGVYLRAQAMRAAGRAIRLDLGDYLRRWYVRENTGRELEDAARKGNLVGVVKVWRGRPVLTSLEVPE
ncbi:MAG: GDYXXLXY domain-containing protein [Synergistaceae bacterium]|nr:GDYXXLXY domain-containing protein [Synergistaceae bacterium]